MLLSSLSIQYILHYIYDNGKCTIFDKIFKTISLSFNYTFFFVLVSLTQLVWTMHKICKVRGLNPGYYQK